MPTAETPTPPPTQRLILRPWREADLPAFAALNSHERVMTHLPKRLSREESDEFANRISAHFDKHGFGLWAVEAPGVAPFIGFVGLLVPNYEAPHTPCVEVGWRLGFDFWNRGYATEAAQAAVAFGFRQFSLEEIVAITVPHNLPSRRVMEKLGMSHDPKENFDHPVLPEGHALRRHVLYRLPASTWRSQSEKQSPPRR